MLNKDTEDFLDRVSNIDWKTKIERALKLCEEAGEVAGAVLSSENVSAAGYKGLTEADVVEELVDVYICLRALLLKYDHSADMLDAIATRKLQKWETALYKVMGPLT